MTLWAYPGSLWLKQVLKYPFTEKWVIMWHLSKGKSTFLSIFEFGDIENLNRNISSLNKKQLVKCFWGCLVLSERVMQPPDRENLPPFEGVPPPDRSLKRKRIIGRVCQTNIHNTSFGQHCYRYKSSTLNTSASKGVCLCGFSQK